MNKLTTALIVTATLFASASSFAYDAIGTVVKVEEAPMICTERRQNLSSSPFLMGVAGALVGNQIGDGSGQVLATAAGAVVGASVGSSNKRHNSSRVDCKFDGYIATIQYEGTDGYIYQTTRQTERPFRLGSRMNINVR